MDIGLKGAVVVVTGGSSGIGRAIVEDLVREGARVSTCARREDRLNALTEELGADIHTAVCDIRDRSQVDRYFDSVGEHFGRIDGLVNNAGESRMKGMHDVTFDDWTDEFELKMSSVWHPTMAALDLLRQSDHASIVNINAVLARQPETRLITTSATRASLLNLSKSLSVELGPEQIRVNSVCLGLVDSGQWRRRFEAADTEESYEEWSRSLADDRGIVLGRLGRPDEVSFVVLSLLSPRSGYVTGTTIDVAGGVGRYV